MQLGRKNDIKQSYLRFLFFRRLASRVSSVLSKPSGGGLQFQLVGVMGHGWLVLGIFPFNFQRKWMKLSTSAIGSVFVRTGIILVVPPLSCRKTFPMTFVTVSVEKERTCQKWKWWQSCLLMCLQWGSWVGSEVEGEVKRRLMWGEWGGVFEKVFQEERRKPTSLYSCFFRLITCPSTSYQTTCTVGSLFL